MMPVKLMKEEKIYRKFREVKKNNKKDNKNETKALRTSFKNFQKLVKEKMKGAFKVHI